MGVGVEIEKGGGGEEQVEQGLREKESKRTKWKRTEERGYEGGGKYVT